jgi:cytochrome c oxidase cbb3-type subunit 1
MVGKLWKTEIYSTSLVGVHFWLALLGTVTYVVALWISAITQGLMWRAYDDFGTLQYTFVESVSATHPYMVMRMIGGMLYNLGAWVMLYNVVMTLRQVNASRATRPVAANA